MPGKNDMASNFIWASDLAPDELERAVSGITERKFQKGSYICHRGDYIEYWAGVVDGLIKMSTIGSSGKAVTFAGLGEGAWFGEGSVLKGEARRYDLVALRDSRIAFMNRATFMWLYENSVGFNHYLLRQINERLSQFIAMVEQDRILDSKARLARNLSWLFNPVLYPGVKDSVDITQDELALLTGVSRAVVNRALGELQEEGLILISHGRVTVPDAMRLLSYGED